MKQAPLPAVLAIHGSAGSGRQWNGLRDRLPERRIMAPCVPCADAPERLAFFADIVRRQSAPVDLVAHSFGAAIAVKLANALPNEVNSLTIYDPVVPVTDARSHGWLPEELWQLWQTHRHSTPDRLMQAFVNYWGTPHLWDQLSPNARRALMALADEVRRDFRQMTAGDWIAPATTFGGAMHLILGSTSPGVIRKMSDDLLRRYPHAQILHAPGLGHMAPTTHPDCINEMFARCVTLPGPALSGTTKDPDGSACPTGGPSEPDRPASRSA